MTKDFFGEIEGYDAFRAYVIEIAHALPAEVDHYVKISKSISEERIKLAHGDYVREIKRFSAYLQSQNPDHYKRAGALLKALCSNPIVVDVSFPDEFNPEELRSGFTRLNSVDAAHVAKYLEFYGEFYCEILAFDAAYKACAAYEDAEKPISMEMLHNISRYLKTNSLPIDAFFMLFRLLYY